MMTPESNHSPKHQKMMSLGESIPVRITDSIDEKRFTEGEIRVQHWNKKERTARALKIGGLCWFASTVCIIFPLVHFFLVPGFFIAGPIVFLTLLNQESAILGGEGLCPHCNAFLPIARSSYRFLLSDLCTSCQSSVKINPAKVKEKT